MGKKLNKNVPVLRFPEFSEPWLIKSVSALVKENFIYKPLDGNHGNLHPTSFDYVKSGIPFVMSNDIQDGVINYSKCHYISEDLARSLQKGFSKEGDVLLTHKGTVGEVAIVGKTAFPFIMLTPQVTYYRVKNPKLLSNLFLASLFTSYNFQRMLKVLAAGGTRPYIGIIEQGKLTISIPSLPEQEKIASFLGALDTRLNQLRRKRELLQTYKRGVMQKIFTQKIRFKSAIGLEFPEWEEKTLGEIAIFKNGKAHENHVVEYGKFIIVNSKFISTEGEIEKYSNYQLEPLHKQDIVMVMSDVPNGKALAKCFYIQEDNKFTLNQRICSLKSNIVSSKFLFYYLSRNPYFLAFDNGVSQTNLRKEDILQCPVFTPSFVESQKIANFLTAIDHKIETLTRQIEQTEKFKKGLLQKLFI
jgi:type I restriction enzyme S subunit